MDTLYDTNSINHYYFIRWLLQNQHWLLRIRAKMHDITKSNSFHSRFTQQTKAMATNLDDEKQMTRYSTGVGPSKLRFLMVATGKRLKAAILYHLLLRLFWHSIYWRRSWIRIQRVANWLTELTFLSFRDSILYYERCIEAAQWTGKYDWCLPNREWQKSMVNTVRLFQCCFSASFMDSENTYLQFRIPDIYCPVTIVNRQLYSKFHRLKLR